VIKRALIKIGGAKEERMLLIPVEDFFKRLGKEELNIRKSSEVHHNLQSFLCLDPTRFPNFILLKKLCKTVETFLGNHYLQSIGIKVSGLSV
jgi:ribosomal protein RSM22 (predicted rRNA methylase)